jgi:hypothetical protein
VNRASHGRSAPVGGLSPLLRHHLIARAALLTQGTTTVALGWLSPTSLTRATFEAGSVLAWLVLTFMTLLIAGAWLDLLLNDVLRRRFHWVEKHEALVYMLIGLCYWMQAFAGSSTADDGAWVLIANYVFFGAVCNWYGFARALRNGGGRG